MNILILGVGNMGSALAQQFTQAGHRVHLATRLLDKAVAVAADIPGTQAVALAGSAADNEVILVATPYEQATAALKAAGPVDGKVVIDLTNPIAADFSGLTVGLDNSAAEEIARAVPNAEVVKAFNTLFAQVLAEGPDFAHGQTANVFYASDSDTARTTVRDLIKSIGFQPVDAGPLKNARYLEPVAGLNIWFGYGAGQGTAIAPAWISRS